MRFQTLLMSVMFLWCIASPSHSQVMKKIRFGFLIDGPAENNRDLVAKFQNEVTALSWGNFQPVFSADKQLTGNWSAESVRQNADTLLRDLSVDVIVSLGVIASNDLCKRSALAKPVIALFAMDAVLQNLPYKDGTSGMKNLNYLTVPHNFFRDVETFQRITSFKKLAIVTSPYYLAVLPSFGESIKKELAPLGIETTVVSAASSASETLAQVAGAEAVYLAPILHWPANEWTLLVNGLHQKRVPTFSFIGKPEVAKGALAGLNSDRTIAKIMRRAAVHVQRIVSGENAGSLPVNMIGEENLVINMATARALGISPSYEVASEAELLNDDETVTTTTYDLASVVNEALQVNLDLKADYQDMMSGQQDVRRARSYFLPTLEVSGSAYQIDADRADASFQPNKTLSGSVTVSQLLFSEKTFANLSIRKNLQLSREWSYQQTRLDITRDAAKAYFDLLKAASYDRIQKDNVTRTRSHLQMAKFRETVGATASNDVYRWEYELANDHKNAIEAVAMKSSATIAVNRLLGRKQDEALATKEIDLSDSLIARTYERYFEYVNNPAMFTYLRDFLVKEGLAVSPDLKTIDAAIDAQQRKTLSARRNFWLPEIGLQAQATQIFYKHKNNGPGIPGLPQANDMNWSIGLNASFDLFDGTRKFVELSQSNIELNKLMTQRRSAEQKIEQAIRSNLYFVGSSFSSIRYSRSAAEAAKKNLDIVTNKYSAGTATIVDLLDAQHAALSAEQLAANATYDFMINLMEVQRVSGRFVFMMSESEQDAFFDRLKNYVQENLKK